VEGASKRSILRDCGIGHQALAKILTNPEPPDHQVGGPRQKPKLGAFLGVIDEILRRTSPHRRSSATRDGASSSASVTSTATPRPFSLP
jgi:hypothetical protein